MANIIDNKSYQDFLRLHWPGVKLEIERSLAILPEQGRNIPSHVVRNQGKCLRGCLLLLISGAFKAAPLEAYPLAAAIELVHAASLLHDDIEDNARLRRGKTSTHVQFGIKGALLAGDALLALALNICARRYHPEINKIFASAILDTVNGQCLELAGYSSQADYFQAIQQKTGSLMGAACEMGGALAGQNHTNCEILRELGQNLGVAYQLADDWQDFLPSELTGKDQGQDILRGNITLPFRLFLDTLPKIQQSNLIEQIRQGELGQPELKEICNAALTAELEAKIDEYIYSIVDITRKKLTFLPDCSEKILFEQIVMQISKRGRNTICRQS